MTYPKLDGEYYNNNSSVQKSLADDILRLHKFKINENILDIGCGDGAISCKMANLSPHGNILGIDKSSEMINFAKNNMSSNFKNLNFENISAEDLNYQDKFTLITAFNSLYWVDDINKVLDNIYQALKNNGRFLGLIYPLESPYWQPFIQVLKTSEFKDWYKHSICPNWLTISEYTNFAKKYNFKILCSNAYTDTIIYKSKQEFKSYVGGWLPCLLTAPQDILGKYLDKVIELMWDKYANNDGSASPEYLKLYFYLEK